MVQRGDPFGGGPGPSRPPRRLGGGDGAERSSFSSNEGQAGATNNSSYGNNGGQSFRGQGRGGGSHRGRGGGYRPGGAGSQGVDGQGHEGRRDQGNRFQGPRFGFNRLCSFLEDQEDSTVIQNIFQYQDDWETLVKNDSLADERYAKGGRGTKVFCDDMLNLVVYILGEKVCSETTTLTAAQTWILAATVNCKQFQDKITKKFMTMLMHGPDGQQRNMESRVPRDLVRFLRCLVNIVKFTSRAMKTSAISFISQIYPPLIGMFGGWQALNRAISTELEVLKNELTHLHAQKEEWVKVVNHQQQEKARRRIGPTDFTDADVEQMHNAPPPDNFRYIPIVPEPSELLTEEMTFIRPLKVSGAYNDAEHYLDVQFRLLREDFVRPLKEGIQGYLNNKKLYQNKKKRPPIGNVRLYHDVKLLDIEDVKGVRIQYIQLPDRSRKIQWDKSKRLLNGNLLVFTPDDFRTVLFGMVQDRNRLKTNLALGITWHDRDVLLSDLRKWDNILMVESEVYFEASRHTLKILQSLELDKFHMSKFIVHVSIDVAAPRYVQDTRFNMKIGDRQIFPLNFGQWPTASELHLDDRQYAAYQACLTREFVIVQGPPGTGKTFLGLRVVETLLQNLQLWHKYDDNDDEGEAIPGATAARPATGGPILIVCYTNHALDQFLEGIHEVFLKLNQIPKIIRVGGKSSSDAMSEFSLQRQRNLAFSTRRDIIEMRQQRVARAKLGELEEEFAVLKNELQHLKRPSGIVLLKKLSFYDDLVESDDPNLSAWAGYCSKLEYFGYDPSVFNNSAQNLNALIQQRFDIRLDSTETVTRIVGDTSRARNDSGGNSGDEDSENEDYDLDELLQKRLLEEVYDEESTSTPTTVFRSAILQLCESELKQLEQQLEKYEQQISKTLQQNLDLIPAGLLAAEANNVKRQRQQKLAEYHNLKVVAQQKKASLVAFKGFTEAVMNLKNQNRLTLSVSLEAVIESGVTDYTELSEELRWGVYFRLLEKAVNLGEKRLTDLHEKVTQARDHWQDLRNEIDGKLLSESLIVGMTTTGAAKYNDLLRRAQAKIVIVEEAAEVLESHIVTCITPACQQLILIGDHQQLRPSTTVYELSKKFNLDISLFERMVKNNLNCLKLLVQHRMRPEIADLVHGTIYDQLKNDPKVYEYPSVTGVSSNLFFLSHTFGESGEEDSLSKSNKYEAEFLAAFCRYLIQQGYSPSQITILTTYTGQMFLLKQCLKGESLCTGVRVTCVDNFQGEENDIILLSLVRNNEAGNIGFLRTDNRVCVALSRAKHGMFVLGNMDQLSEKSKTWEKISQKLQKRGGIGKSLQIQCEIHKTLNEITTASQFGEVAPEGGCLQPCQQLLNCGHICKSVCHILDRQHEKYRCPEPCPKFCARNHACKRRCFEKCPDCKERVLKALPCGHSKVVVCYNFEEPIQCFELVTKELACKHPADMACYMDPNKYTCRIKVIKKLPCGHEKELECSKDIYQVQCRVIVEKTLLCGHTQMEPCHVPVDSVKCMTELEVRFPECEHKGKKYCYSPDPNCKNPCSTRLDCGHACAKSCHPKDDPEHLEYKCKRICARQCDRGHNCKKGHQCCTSCDPCQERVKTKLTCGHERFHACHQDPALVQCIDSCKKKLPCGHACRNRCFEDCGPCKVLIEKQGPCGHLIGTECGQPVNGSKCETLIPSPLRAPCGHAVSIPCGMRSEVSRLQLEQYCTSPCNFWIPEKEEGGCGHKCKGTCKDCHQGRLHVKCGEKCGRSLPCGHVCDFPCSVSCPPCKKKCDSACEHSKCSKACGEPCAGCVEPCTWICDHKRCNKRCQELCDREPCDVPCKKTLPCGHKCIGFCGEPCPKYCRECDKEELLGQWIGFGTEDEQDARFVLLQDCGHVIEAQGMDYYMNQDIEEGQIEAKVCPLCKTLIRKSNRYGNILKTKLKDVMAVKKLKFGKTQKVQTELIEKMKPMRQKCTAQFLTFANHIWNHLVHTVTSKRTGEVHYKPRQVDIATLVSLNEMVKFLEEIIDTLPAVQSTFAYARVEDKLKPEYRQKYTNQVLLLFDNVMHRQLPLSTTECRNLDLEFNRLFDRFQLYQILSSPKYYPGRGQQLVTQIKALLNGLRPYVDEEKAKVKTLLKQLEEAARTGLGISDRERKDILAAIGLSAGRWFKCPNGHIYIITECGGAMEESVCNECGARIGGRSHLLRSDNALATEMDGATQPLYPNMIG